MRGPVLAQDLPSMRSPKPIIPLGLILFACGEEPVAPPVVEEAPLVRPERVEALTSEVREIALPEALRSDATISISSLEGTGTLIGGAAGLFQLTGTELVAIDAEPVTALASIAGTGIVVGRTGGVSVWNGTLIDSPLTDAIEGMRVSALFEKSGALYVGTESSFYLLEAGELSQFAAIDGASQLAGYAAGPALVIDERLILRRDAGAWSLQDLGDELAAERTIPAAGDRLLASDGGALFERISVDGGVVWRAVALSLEAEEGARGVSHLATDPISGNAWVVTADQVARIGGTVVASMPHPAGLGAPIAARATGGVLWISDGTTLVRIGDDEGPVTYAKDIAAFSANNCERCHRPLGVGRPLGSFEAWVENVDAAIVQLDEMRMPQDGAPLVGGTVELIRAWKADGLLP
jgi:hypothetical protein